MVLSLRQAHGVESKLVSLKCHLQAAGGAHLSPGCNLVLVQYTKSPAQCLNRIVFKLACGFV